MIVLTWDSHVKRMEKNDSWQATLVKELFQSSLTLIVVALKSPSDLVDFPEIGTYLITCGTTTGQIQGLADVLVGLTDPQGVNPLPQLP